MLMLTLSRSTNKVRKIFSSRIVLMTRTETLLLAPILGFYDVDVQSRNDYSGIVRIFSESMSDLRWNNINESTILYVVSAAENRRRFIKVEINQRLRKLDLPKDTSIKKSSKWRYLDGDWPEFIND